MLMDHRPRGSAMRGSLQNTPSGAPLRSKASSAPNPSPLTPDALVTRRGIEIPPQFNARQLNHNVPRVRKGGTSAVRKN